MTKLSADYSYTDAELLALLREAYARITVEGQSYQFRGRMLTEADLGRLSTEIDRLERKIAAAANGLQVVPVRFKRAQ